MADNDVNSVNSEYRLPWIKYENIFKIVKLKEDFESYQKYLVRCKYCVSTKLLTADTRTCSNLLKHLEVSTYSRYSNDYNTLCFCPTILIIIIV